MGCRSVRADAGLSEPADHPGGAVGAGRLERHPGAARRSEARTQVRQAVIIENRPAAAASPPRLASCAALRRRHHDHGVEHDDVAQCHDPEADAVRSAQGSHPDRDDRAHAICARRHPALPVHSVADLVRLAREKKGQLSFARRPCHDSTAERGDPANMSILIIHVPYKARPGAERCRRRAHRLHVRRCRAGAVADPVRQAARAGRHDGRACRRR